MIVKALTVLAVGLAAAVAILQAGSVDAFRPRHPLARRHLSARGPVVHGGLPLQRHLARRERMKPETRRLGDIYDESYSKHDSSDSYDESYGKYDSGDSYDDNYGKYDSGDSYDESYGKYDSGDSYDESYGKYDSSDSYDDSYARYGPSYGYVGGFGGDFVGGFPPGPFNGFENAGAAFGPGPIPAAGVATAEAAPSVPAGAAAPKVTAAEAKKPAESAKPKAGAK